MRVTFFCPTLGDGGADRVVVTLLRHLDRRRFAVTLVVMRREGALVDEVPSDVEVIALGASRLAVAAPSLAGVLRRTRPDVVISMHGGSNIIAVLAHALARSSSRLVLSERSALIRPDRGWLRRRLEIPAKRLTYRRADLVIAVSDGVARQLADRVGVAEAKVRIVGNPMVDDDLDTRCAAPIEHPWFASATPIILAVGRLVAIKAYPTLLAAFARIRRVRDVRLAILGEGPLRDDISRRARELGVERDVALLGFDKNPFKYMARAAMLLHASEAEGLPGALIQAMACGTPVVSTDCDFGPREVISSGEDGFLVPVGDAEALAEHALQLLANEPLRRSFGERARTSARRFTTSTAVADYEEAIAGC